MDLYHFPLSSNARKAVMTSIILESPVELKLVDLAKGEQRTEQFRQLNPNGKVPVLVDGALVLWESHAIMIYLAEKAAQQTLLPESVAARADVIRWLFWSTAHFITPIGVLNFENMLKARFGMGAPDPTRVKTAETELTIAARVLDDHLKHRTWVSGSGLTLADISLACPLMSTVPAKLPVTGFAHLQDWFARVRELPAWKQTEP